MNTENTLFTNPFGNFTLQRIPHKAHNSLRAWDAADEYLLSHLHDHNLLNDNSHILVINDQFGALAVSLHQYHIQSWSDSYINTLATEQNMTLNQLTVDNIKLIPSTELPSQSIDIVLIKIPKTLALLEDQLIKLKPFITADTHIIAAAMVKHFPKSALSLLEKILGTTKTSLAVKKARLAFTQYDNAPVDSQSPYPNSLYIKELDINLSHHANVFSKDKLDYGSLLMIEQFHRLPPNSQHLVDLGCGNGLLGIMARRQLPDCKMTFLDESYMAVASAKMNYAAYYQDDLADFQVSHALSSLEAEPSDLAIDLVLCNPPFHQQYAIGDEIAWLMFTSSFRHLASGGELWVVGNRHMQYASKLKKIFGNVQELAVNKKFQVVMAKKSG